MSILNQPFSIDGNDKDITSLGNVLLKEIADSKYNELSFFSAFAKNSGVLRIAPTVDAFKKRGGKVRAFIGIDLQGTSQEALVNLLRICDELYVVHSNGGHTYHTKIYYLEGKKDYWYAVGSNNLTAGGLWTNIESCYFKSTTTLDPEIVEIKSLITKYTSNTFDCSIKISSEADIKKLKDDGYIASEASLENYSGGASSSGRKKKDKRFGEVKARIPRITRNKEKNEEEPTETEESAKKEISYLNESFWFQTKKATGGSRNILDLSKTGRVSGGSAVGTKYEIAGNHSLCLGGVVFFGINPTNYSESKDITINYDGSDYSFSTILYPTGPNANGTWRMQIKGDNITSPSGHPLSWFGSHDSLFINKILIFDKMGEDYYALYVIEDNKQNLSTIKKLSIFWAKNGSASAAKLYGFLPKKSSLL